MHLLCKENETFSYLSALVLFPMQNPLGLISYYKQPENRETSKNLVRETIFLERV